MIAEPISRIDERAQAEERAFQQLQESLARILKSFERLEHHFSVQHESQENTRSYR